MAQTYDPAKRAASKQKARERDDRALASGRLSAEELQRRNGFIPSEAARNAVIREWKEFDEQDLADPEPLEVEFERLAFIEDDSAANETLASGRPISIAYPDTPAGYVVEVHPDGREELVRVDREEAARILG